MRHVTATSQRHGLLHDLTQHAPLGHGAGCHAPLLGMVGGGGVSRLPQKGKDVEDVAAAGAALPQG